MRVRAALAPAQLAAEGLHSQAVVVIDVFRAATTITTALAHGCRLIVPVLTPADARERAREFPSGELLLAGERGGEPIAGFDLGNSPLEYTADRVAGKTIILTTSNGTPALLRAGEARATAVGALVNVTAVARWLQDQARDVTLLCAGDGADASLEDSVCAGLIVEALVAAGTPCDLADPASISRGVAREYRQRLEDLAIDSTWGRHLARIGRHADLAACLRLDAYPLVPILQDGVLRRAGGGAP